MKTFKRSLEIYDWVIFDYQKVAFIAIVIDAFVGIACFLLVWQFSNLKRLYEKSEDEIGPWSLAGRSIGPFIPFVGYGKIVFIITKIILAFGLPFVDTFLGKPDL